MTESQVRNPEFTPDPDSERLRDCLASAAFAFASGTEIPRDRALNQSAIASLIATYNDVPFTRDNAIAAISNHGNLPELRPHVASQLFDKLVSSQYIGLHTPGSDPKYCLAPSILSYTKQQQAKVDKVIDSTLSQLFHSLSLTLEHRRSIRRALFACIARMMQLFGKHYAYQVSGRAEGTIDVSRKQIHVICVDVITKSERLPINADQLTAAISELFARREPDFSAFVFAVTQNYFYLRLLALDGGLAALSEEQYQGAQFWLDTNVLIAFLFPESRHHRSIRELHALAKRLHASLQITESTLEEYRLVLSYNRKVLLKTFDVVPDKLLAKTRSVFLHSYRSEKRNAPALTIERYLASLPEPRSVLKDTWGIEVADDPIESRTDAALLLRIKQALLDASRSVRRKGKGDSALSHDAHVYLIVMDERTRFGDRSAWLLTLDSSLPAAAISLQPESDKPFCMSLDGFLQVMSPYVRVDHQQSFAEMFVEVISRNLFPPEDVMELEDFRMFTEFDIAIGALPPEDVQKIVRRVKRSLGGELKGAQASVIAYEVQKALADPTLAHRAEAARIIDALKEQLRKKEGALDQRVEELRLSKQRHEVDIAAERLAHSTREASLEEKLKEQELAASQAKERLQVIEAERGKNKSPASNMWTVGALAVVMCAIWFLPNTWYYQFKHAIVFKLGVTLGAVGIAVAVIRGSKWEVAIGLGIAIVSAIVGIGGVLR